MCGGRRLVYYEAAAAQPGNPVGDEIQKWFWRQTTAGKLLLDLQEVCRKSADQSMQMLGRILLMPRAVVHTIKLHSK